MPSVAYGASAYRRTEGGFPELKLVNLYLEKAATSEKQAALVSRPGLGQLSAVGTGPINGIFSKPGTLGGDVFSISGTSLYRGTTELGSVAGSGVASWAGGYGEVLVTRGSALRHYDGATLASVAFPDSADVRAICFIGSLFVAVRGDDSAKFYWSDPLDGTTWDALNFATAEREPDALLDIAPLGDNIWLFGQQTIESWANTGSADAPFSRNENVAFDKGILATGCVASADNSLFFVGSDGVVYRVSDVPLRVSDNGIEERILGSASCRLFTFSREGHEFVCVRLDDSSMLYDCSTGAWCEFQSDGGQWLASCAAMQGNVAHFGHQADGKIMGWSGWDDLGVALERLFSFAQQVKGPTPVSSIRLWANSGHTTVLEGQGSDPIVELRTSRNAGNTFGDWKSARLGAAGEYRAAPTWRRCGTFDFPGLMGECRVTDPTDFRVSSVRVNDPIGGRSRG